MTNARIARHCLLLSLPSVALISLSILFLVHSVPRIQEKERQWAFVEAKRIADEMRTVEGGCSFVWEYDKGVLDGGENWRALFPAQMTWKDWDSKGSKRKDKMWGWKDVEGVRVVWVRDGDKVYAKSTGIAETDYRRIFWLFGPLLLASIVASAGFTIYSLIAYAKSREDFLAATTHDLITPLVGMRWMIGRRDDEAQMLNERLIRIVRNITEFMRLGGRRRYKTEIFDLRDAFDEAYDLFAADFRDLFRGEDVPLEIEGDNFFVEADELATIQIIWNILGNDLKYAAPFGKVRAKFSNDGKAVRLDLIDDGPGMTFMQRRHAFDRFWRARTVLESGKGGFGIGLGVAREAAIAMGGALTLAPNTPKGCIFTLSLPICIAPRARLREENAAARTP